MRYTFVFLLISIVLLFEKTDVIEADVHHVDHQQQHHSHGKGDIHPKKYLHANDHHIQPTGQIQPTFGIVKRIFGIHRIDGHFNHNSHRQTNITFKIDSGKNGNQGGNGNGDNDNKGGHNKDEDHDKNRKKDGEEDKKQEQPDEKIPPPEEDEKDQ